MSIDYRDMIHKVNWLSNDLDSLYHLAGRKLGVADSVLIVLYSIHEKGDGCLLHDICLDSGLSKQTINSAIRKLEQEDILFLEQDKGRTKRVFLTEKGTEFLKRTAVRLAEVETNAFSGWTDEELEMHLKLMKKYNDAFREEIEKMEGRNNGK